MSGVLRHHRLIGETSKAKHSFSFDYCPTSTLLCVIAVVKVMQSPFSSGIVSVCSACLYKGWESLGTSQFGLILIQGVKV